MQKDQSDLELNLKKRARRRLVGAIALVLLMIILLPMLLKDRAASNPQEKITITLPNEASTTVTPSQPVTSDFDSNVVPHDSVDKVPPAEAAAANTEAPTGTEIIDLPEPAIKEPAIKEPVIKEPPPAKEPVKAASAQKFFVQVGVFSDADNVKKLQTKLTDLGYKSQTEKISTPKGDKIRLKTQVFADRNEATIALENIKDAGLTGMLVSQ